MAEASIPTGSELTTGLGKTTADVDAFVSARRLADEGWRDLEAELRQRWYQVHVARFDADAPRLERERAVQRGFRQSAPAALGLRDALARTGDVEAFRSGVQQWALEPGTVAFRSQGGAGFLNQLAKRSDDHATLARVLSDVLTPPTDENAVGAKVQLLADFVDSIKVGAYPAPGHVPFFLSYFWALADDARWPIAWPRSVTFLEFVTGEALPTSPAERYDRYLALQHELEGDNWRFWWVAVWWDETTPVFLDPVLVDRCRYGLGIGGEDTAEAADGDDSPAYQANAAALATVARHLGAALADDVSAVAGQTLSSRRVRNSGVARSELTVNWMTPDDWALGIRLWVGQEGAAIGLRPGWVRDGWYDEAASVVDELEVPGFVKIGAPGSKHGEDRGFVGGWMGEFVYARWYQPDALASLDLRSEVVAVTAAVQPLLDALVQRATGASPAPTAPDPLLRIIDEFRRHGYPTPADQEHIADRERFAALLARDTVALTDPRELGRIWNTRRYGGPGSQSVLNTSIRDGDAAEYDRIVDTFSFVCWGDGDDHDDSDVAARIDTVLDVHAPRYVKGLGESVILKMLAITHPERFIPVFPYSGPKGKRRMLHLLALDEPAGDSRGRLQVESNDRLRARLDRFFPGDPWGMTQFLYWYAEREEEVAGPGEVLDILADDLLVDRDFLGDIVSLLEDKGQLILYGPPGTGKTYLARKLAEALVPDPTRRSLVQFHPSTSYEDFFEGYRPEATVDGEMTYRLTPGPLALLAARAAEAPGKRHIMIIDEVNRANLPKVLGELLFLFEYRDEQVRTLYRPDDAFELPRDLWFIGTMNTADRSIALVDAALRRRFHFVPFFPNQGPMAGHLDRWLEAHSEAVWVGELVAMVNDELTEALGGPHLQLGPSHFMKSGIDEAMLRRIWTYNIEPFIEDQFFGDVEQIEHFRFDAVLRRYNEESGRADLLAIEDGAADLHSEPAVSDQPADGVDDDGEEDGLS